jgi:HK97 family phage prohead protease
MSDGKIERRFNRAPEIRMQENESGPVIVGYAAVFGSRSFDLGGFTEIIKPGAFTRTLASKPDARALVNHESGLMTIGRTTNGTLELSEDEIGLRATIYLPDTQAGRDTLTLVKRGDLDQMSFAFWVIKDNWIEERGSITRELHEVSIDNGDVSVVTFPAYGDTMITARSMMNLPEIPSELLQAQLSQDSNKDGAQRALRRMKLNLLKIS